MGLRRDYEQYCSYSRVNPKEKPEINSLNPRYGWHLSVRTDQPDMARYRSHHLQLLWKRMAHLTPIWLIRRREDERVNAWIRRVQKDSLVVSLTHCSRMIFACISPTPLVELSVRIFAWIRKIKDVCVELSVQPRISVLNRTPICVAPISARISAWISVLRISERGLYCGYLWLYG